MTQSVARTMQKVIDALDEAGVLEQEKELLKKAKKEKEANAKDPEIDSAIAKGQKELDALRPRLASLKSYDRSMFYYYQSYYNLAYQNKIKDAISNYLNVVKEEDTAEKLRVEAYYVLSQLYLSEADFNSLESLNLSYNKLSHDSIRNLYSLKGLKILDLAANNFE